MSAWGELYGKLLYMRDETAKHPEGLVQVTPTTINDMVSLMERIRQETIQKPVCSSGNVINYGDIIIGSNNRPVKVRSIEFYKDHKPSFYGFSVGDPDAGKYAVITENDYPIRRFNADTLEQLKSDMEYSAVDYCRHMSIPFDNAGDAEVKKRKSVCDRMDALWALGQQ